MRRALLALPVLLMLSAQAPKEAALPPKPKPPAVNTVQQCRAACDRRYYFCLAEAEPETCAPQWAQCRNRCGTGLPR